MSRLTQKQASSLKKYYSIYKIVNLKNNKVYIGVHKVWNNKKDNYICSSKVVLSLIKKNPEDFKRVIIARYSTAAEANKYERLFIKKYNSFKSGYNRSKNGGSYCAKGFMNKKYGKKYCRKDDRG